MKYKKQLLYELKYQDIETNFNPLYSFLLPLASLKVLSLATWLVVSLPRSLGGVYYCTQT